MHGLIYTIFISMLIAIGPIIPFIPHFLPKEWTVLRYGDRSISIFTILLWLSLGLLILDVPEVQSAVISVFVPDRERFYYSENYLWIEKLVLPRSFFLLMLNFGAALSPVPSKYRFLHYMMRGFVAALAIYFWLWIFAAYYLN